MMDQKMTKQENTKEKKRGPSPVKKRKKKEKKKKTKNVNIDRGKSGLQNKDYYSVCFYHKEDITDTQIREKYSQHFSVKPRFAFKMFFVIN